MYDPPELRREVDAWWSGLVDSFRREGIRDVPDRLDRDIAFDRLWSAPDLLFAQACGFPMVGKWAGRIQYLATPRYAAPGCDGAKYCSWVVVPASSAARSIEIFAARDARSTVASPIPATTRCVRSSLRSHATEDSSAPSP
jgi:hypothetical protein